MFYENYEQSLNLLGLYEIIITSDPISSSFLRDKANLNKTLGLCKITLFPDLQILEIMGPRVKYISIDPITTFRYQKNTKNGSTDEATIP